MENIQNNIRKDLNKDISFSNRRYEKKHVLDSEKGEISILNEENEKLGLINYELPTEQDTEKLLRIINIAIERSNRGNGLSPMLYDELISFAKDQGLGGIRSGSIVEHGATMANWKKLQDAGYNITVHPEISDEWNKFLEANKSNQKYEIDMELSNPMDSAFILRF